MHFQQTTQERALDTLLAGDHQSLLLEIEDVRSQLVVVRTQTEQDMQRLTNDVVDREHQKEKMQKELEREREYDCFPLFRAKNRDTHQEIQFVRFCYTSLRFT